MSANHWQLIGNELAVVWNDGHESYYPLESLRRECPCAACSGEPDLFGRISKGPAPRYNERSFQLSTIERTGNYGLQLGWGDNHTYGIWTFARLRSFCPCPACGKSI